MSNYSHFRSELVQIINKCDLDLLEKCDQKIILQLLTDMNKLLETNENKAQSVFNTMSLRFKNYVVSTLKLSSLSKMISGVAHEINTPLAIIQIRTDQLTENTETNDFNKEIFEKSLSSIDQTAKKIGAIVTRLRSYAKSLNSKDITRVSAKQLIENTIALTKDQFLTEGITVEIEHSEKDYEINCCPSDIGQALLNLLNNSFEALKGRPEKWIRIKYGLKDRLLLIEVTDPGPGIKTEIQTKIFEPFFTTSDDPSRLGLGLTIAQDYLSAYQGNLIFDSTSPMTKFTMSLPAADTFDPN